MLPAVQTLTELKAWQSPDLPGKKKNSGRERTGEWISGPGDTGIAAQGDYELCVHCVVLT